MDKKIIATTNAPAPIGPYSQAVMAGGFLFLSGQVAIDPTTSQVIVGSVEDETHQVMRNIQAVLTVYGMDFQHIIKTTIFLKDMNDFAKVNAVYGSYFKDAYPARETVEVARLPKDVKVEISVIAVQ